MEAQSEHLVYKGYAYRQAIDNDCPWIVTFVASAEELLTWAGIPHRSDENVTAFQRPEDSARVTRAKEFFDDPHNQSPTAIVVGIHKAPEGMQPGVTVEFESNHHSIRPCTVTVNYAPASLTLEERVAIVKAQILARLDAEAETQATAAPTAGEDHPTTSTPTTATTSTALAIETDDSGIPSDDSTGDSADEEDDAIENGEEEDIEIGRSLLQTLLLKLDDPTWCEANREALFEMSKPATVIDGQHRLRGAEACEREIPFTVCALLDCSWPEQVFQFTVVNYTAKGIPDQFITANAALSLTGGELGQLQKRLVQAGVKVIEYELMRHVHFDSRSPFYNLVNLTEKPDLTKIGYKTMVRIAKTWYLGKHHALKTLLSHLYPDVKGHKGAGERMRRWKHDGHWALFFVDFWDTIKDNYKSHHSHASAASLWTVGESQLMVAIVLFELQNTFLDNLGAQDDEYFEPKDASKAMDELRQKIKDRARKVADYVPAEFFATKWGLVGLNIGPGRETLRGVFQSFVNTKGKFQYEKSSLLTGKIS